MSEGIKISKVVAYSLLGPPQLHVSKVVVYSLVSTMSIITALPSDNFAANIVESGGILKGPIARPLFAQIVDDYGSSIVDTFKCDILPDYRRWCSESYGAELQDYVALMLQRTYPVLPYPSSYPLRHTIRHNFEVNSLGDGYEQTISNELPRTRADGMGGVTSYYGLNVFTLQFNKMSAGIDKVANRLWDFFRTRLENGNEPFYLYNPVECGFIIDTTCRSLIGRYLVRLEEPNQMLSREYYKYCLFSFNGIKLVEDRTALNVITAIGINVGDVVEFSENIETPQIKAQFADDVALVFIDVVSNSKVLKPVVTPNPVDLLSTTISDNVNISLLIH
jgi:hypothetical protein